MELIKKHILPLFIALLMSGCYGPVLYGKSWINLNNKQLDRILINESKDSAFNRLTNSAIVFTEALGHNKHKLILSPLGSDLIYHQEKRFETWFFYTNCKKRDGKATRDETTPYVFLNNRFYGKGWELYDSISK